MILKWLSMGIENQKNAPVKASILSGDLICLANGGKRVKQQAGCDVRK
jgi:hypothetical protein